MSPKKHKIGNLTSPLRKRLITEPPELPVVVGEKESICKLSEKVKVTGDGVFLTLLVSRKKLTFPGGDSGKKHLTKPLEIQYPQLFLYPKTHIRSSEFTNFSP
jgi:hypothetical protein